MRAPAIIALLALALAAPACVGTDVGNPADSSTTIEFSGSVQPNGWSHLMATAGGATLDEAWLVFDRVGLAAGAACTDGPGVEGLVAVELVSGVELPAAPLLHHPSDAYCGVSLRLVPATADTLPEGAPAALLGASAYVRGTFGNGDSFELLAPLSETLSLRASPGGTFGLATVEEAVIVAFEIDRWFDGAAFDVLGAGGAVRVDAASHPETIEAFRSNLQTSTLLYRDGNANGVLDLDEGGPALAHGAQP
jgi:hypothetical protein